jgi:Ca2+-binding EF-hand superfamily protein
MLEKLQKYFVALDEDGSNSVSADELEDPLILFGMCQNKQEVEDFFKSKNITLCSIGC